MIKIIFVNDKKIIVNIEKIINYEKYLLKNLIHLQNILSNIYFNSIKLVK